MSIKRLTFDDLRRDPFYSELIALVEQNAGGELSDDVKEWMVDQAQWTEVVPTQVSEWGKEVDSLADRLLSGNPAVSDFSLFWIRLYGLLEEIAHYFAPGSMRVQVSRNAQQVSSLVGQIRAKITEAEFKWIEHERMCQCHVTPEYFRKALQGKPGGSFILKSEYKGLPVDSLTADLRSVIEPYKGDSRPLALDLARRLKSELNALAFSISAWRNER